MTEETSESRSRNPKALLSKIRRKFDDRSVLAKTIILSSMLVVWVIFTVNARVMFDTKPVQIWVNVPSYAQKGEEFECTVEIWDWSERLSKSYNGEVSFKLLSYNLSTYSKMENGISAELPDPTQFAGSLIDIGGLSPSWFIGDTGKRVFDLKINTPGIHYVVVEDNDGLKGISNPIRITSDKPDKYLLWGDIHTHSANSDGSGTPEQVHEFARDLALLDFYALTDHGEGFGITTDERARWQIDYNQQVAEDFNKDGEFVTFQGVEWTTSFGLIGKEYGYGHYTVISDQEEPLRISRGLQLNPDELWDYLDEYTSENDAKVIALPHHLTQTNFEMDWAGMNPEYVRTADIFSVHGACLLQPDDKENHMGMVHVHHDPTPGAAAVDALRMGHKIALVSNSDTHDGRPGHAICHKASHYANQNPLLGWTAHYGHPYPGGITGVWTEGFDRENIMDAIRQRAVVATRSLFRPLINFSINGHQVGVNGSTVNVLNVNSQRNINFQLIRDGLELGWNGEADLGEFDEVTIEIWKNSELWQTNKSKSPFININAVDSTQINGTSYEDYVEKDGKYYLHERAVLEVEDPNSLNTNGQDYYFVRCFSGEGTIDDFYAWIGPIWVDPQT